MTTSFNPKPYILIIIIIVTVLSVVALLSTTTEGQSNLNIIKRVLNEGDSLKTWKFSSEYGEAFIYINNTSGLIQDSFVVINKVRNSNNVIVDSFYVNLINLQTGTNITTVPNSVSVNLGIAAADRVTMFAPAGERRSYKTVAQFIGDIQIRRLTPSSGSGNADTIGVGFKPMELP